MSNTVTLNDIIQRIEILTRAVLSNKNALSLEEAAAYTGLSVSYLYKLTSTQQIPHHKPRGKMLYFSRDELDSWLLQHRVKTTDEIEQQAVNYVSRL